MLQHRLANRVEIERTGQRLLERDQPLQIARARFRFLRRRGRRNRFGLHLLPLGLLVQQEHDEQDDQRRNERQPGRLLDLARDVEEAPNRAREDDAQRDREPDDQDAVATAKQAHNCPDASTVKGYVTRFSVYRLQSQIRHGPASAERGRRSSAV